MTYFNEAVNLIQQLHDPKRLVITFSQMANCCADAGLLEQERDYLAQGLNAHPDRFTKAALLERIAISYAKSGQYIVAAEYYEEALSIFETENFRYWDRRVDALIEIYRALGDENAVQRTMKRKQS